jgi:hypothetical protein
MNNTVTTERWVFLCPVHGEEQSLLCFEAFDKKNADRWRQIKIIAEEIETTLEERQAHQESLIAQRRVSI